MCYMGARIKSKNSRVAGESALKAQSRHSTLGIMAEPLADSESSVSEIIQVGAEMRVRAKGVPAQRDHLTDSAQSDAARRDTKRATAEPAAPRMLLPPGRPASI